jgi:hypothetical protein
VIAKLIVVYIAIGCATMALTPAAPAKPRTAHIGMAQKQPPPSTYSKAEIDQKIDQLQQGILSTVPSKQKLIDQLQQGILSTVPSRQELEGRLAKFYSKSDIDTALDQIRRSFPQQTITPVELTARLTDADNITKARERQLYQSLNNKIPKASPWVAIILAAAGTSVSLFVSIASRVAANRPAAQTQLPAQQKRADELHEEWENVKGGGAIQEITENAGFKEEDVKFWDALENASKKGEVQEKIYHVKQELETLSADAAYFPLQWARIVGMVTDISTQIAYISHISDTSTAVAPTLTCPICGSTHTLTLK